MPVPPPTGRRRPRPVARAAIGGGVLLAALVGACSDANSNPNSDATAAPTSETAPAEWRTIAAAGEAPSLSIAWRPRDRREIPRNVAFDLEVQVRREGLPATIDALQVSGWMPAHNHGLVQLPTVRPAAGAASHKASGTASGHGNDAADGRFVVEGLLLHMRGQWELRFTVHHGGRPSILVDTVEVDTPPLPLDSPLRLDDDAIARALTFSPLPDPPPDPTNAVADDPAAARFGQALFFDARLSANGAVSCATCHDPGRSWSDGRTLAKALAHHPRHTPSLWNVAYNRWFFWDGRKDTLWSQALAPFEDPREQGSSRLEVLHVLDGDPASVEAYTQVFGIWPGFADTERFPPAGRPVDEQPLHPHQQAWDTVSPDDRLLVDRAFSNVGKALAAYERLILSRRAPFDVFVEGLRDGDDAKLAALSPAAQRGFALFTGKAACHVCHDGPNFTDLEFHSNRVPTGEGVDPGRALGVLRLKADPFNSASAFADDGGLVGARKLALAPRAWHIPGEFKTPSLRNVAVTAPYMHEGQLQTLEQVVRFYSTLEGAAPPDPSGERLIEARHLTDAEQADLVAFLRSLTDETLPPELMAAPAPPR